MDGLLAPDDMMESVDAQERDQQPQSSSNIASSNGMSTLWAEAFEQWRAVNMKGQMVSKWDQAFALVVSFQEQTSSDKHRLVTTVKEFAASYKADPTSDKVEGLLKFFKKYIGSLFERIEISEKGFLQMYQSLSLAPDPAPLLLSAHVELSNVVGKARELQQLAASKDSEVDVWRKKYETAAKELTEVYTELQSGNSVSATPLTGSVSKDLREVRSQLEDLVSEKRSLIEMVRSAEALSLQGKEEINRLLEEKRLLQNQVMQSHSRYEEYVSRAERDHSTLLEELTEMHHQLLTQGGGAPSATDRPSIVKALESEVEALQTSLQDSQNRCASLEATLHSGVVVSKDQQHAPESVEPTPKQREEGLITFLHAQVAELSRTADELRCVVKAERSARREAESRCDDATRLLLSSRATINRLEAAMQQKAVIDVAVAHHADTAIKAVPAPLVVDRSTNDEVLERLLSFDMGANDPHKPSAANPPVQSPSAASAASDADPLVASLIGQRESLRRRVVQLEEAVASSQQEIQRLQAEVAESNRQAEGAPHSSSVFDDERYHAALYASVGKGKVQQTVSSAAAVTVLSAGGASGTTDSNGKRRRKMIQQTVRKAADSIAVVLANMIVHSAATRMALVLYILGLHIVVMLSTYAMAFRGMRGGMKNV